MSSEGDKAEAVTREATAQRIAYVSADAGRRGHVIDLFHPGRGGKWEAVDLTEKFGAPSAAQAGSALITSWASPSSKHIAYVIPDGSVVELWSDWSDSAWQRKTLTVEARAPGARIENGGIISFFDKTAKHVVYVGKENLIWDLYAPFNEPRTWESCCPDGPPVAFGSSLAGLVSANYSHIFYVTGNSAGTDSRQGHVNEFYQSVKSVDAWKHSDLTKRTAGAPKAEVNCGLTAWATPADERSVAFVAAGDRNLWKLSAKDGPGWDPGNLTGAPVNAPRVAASSYGGLASWTDSQRQYVVYRSEGGSDSRTGDIVALSSPVARPDWIWRNLSGKAHARVSRSGAPGLTDWKAAGTAHVSYLDERDKIWEVYFAESDPETVKAGEPGANAPIAAGPLGAYVRL